MRCKPYLLLCHWTAVVKVICCIYIKLIECNVFISGFHQHTFSPTAVSLICSLPKHSNIAKGGKRMFIVRRRPWKPFSRFSLLILSHLFIPNSSLYQTLLERNKNVKMPRKRRSSNLMENCVNHSECVDKVCDFTQHVEIGVVNERKEPYSVQISLFLCYCQNTGNNLIFTIWHLFLFTGKLFDSQCKQFKQLHTQRNQNLLVFVWYFLNT